IKGVIVNCLVIAALVLSLGPSSECQLLHAALCLSHNNWQSSNVVKSNNKHFTGKRNTAFSFALFILI
ncbi:MAG: hypothetical protein Q7U82_03855, partial [Gammaproteobacteria bacterium]|nr:hypothetical protein [Gammaproteobacteria bacterium]